VSLPKALEDADLWRPITPSPEKNDTRRLIPLATSQSETAGEVPQSTKDHEGRALPVVRPARWRGRPVFLLPWIGAEDIFGPQLGIVSIPLMDHLQDETVRVTALYGLASRFPYQDITLISTRFAPTLMLTYYHQQTYNGRFVYRDTNQTVSSFLEEKGGRLGADWGTRALGGILSTSAEMKVAYFQPYFGPTLRSRGWLVEPGASLALSHQLGDRMSLSNSIGARVAPPWPKHNFDYNALSASTNLNIGLPLQSSLQLGVEGSRTRGKKRRDLLEFYLPLKTFIPGSGGGYNRNSFPLMIGPKGGLFSPRFGDTEARAKANWTVPLIRDVDKLFWIIYAERLDFTAFYNYGGAWTGGEPARGWKRLVGAHGYNVDFQLENKGVRFNIGTGLGQVVSRPWEVYLTTGFDAIF
jgi:hypothetical protein